MNHISLKSHIDRSKCNSHNVSDGLIKIKSRTLSSEFQSLNNSFLKTKKLENRYAVRMAKMNSSSSKNIVQRFKKEERRGKAKKTQMKTFKELVKKKKVEPEIPSLDRWAVN